MKPVHRPTILVYTLLSLSLLPLFFLLPTVSGASACFNGTYTTDLTFTAAQSPICIDGDLQMLAGSSLTIEPGVTVEFMGGHEILIRSKLIANGTATDQIIFTSGNSFATTDATQLKFFGANLNQSSLSHVRFEYADKAIQIGDETEFNQGGKNTGTLLAEDIEIVSAEIRTAGYQTTASIDLNRVTLTNASVFGEYPRSEPIKLRNAIIQNSTITSDSYNNGITIEDATITDSAFHLGCCGANLHLIRADVTDSNFSDNNDYYDVEIIDSTLTNSPINLPWANTLNISGTTIDATGIVSPALTVGNASIEETLIVGNGSGIGVSVSGERFGTVGQTTILSSTIANFATGVQITEADAVSINGSNLAGFTTHAVDNQTNLTIDATSNYWTTSDTTIIDGQIYDQNDDLNSGLVDYGNFLSTASPDAPPIPSIVPILTVSPTAIDLGAVTLNSAASADVLLQNSGSSPIQVSNIASDNPRFTVSPATLTLAAGTSQTVTISFTPVVVGINSAEILITHDAAGGTTAISVLGTGVTAQCTSVNGVITATTTWTASDSPYCLTDDVQVANGATLTIEPDTTIRYESNSELLVKGALNAVGTATQPIIFDGLSNATRLLLFKDATLADSTLAHVQFANASRALQIGEETEFAQGEKNSGTLTISNMEVISAEIRTAGYETGAALTINGATLTNATVFGEYPRSEAITINDASINDSTITSDSYNAGITLNSATISNTALTIGCCGANFTIENSTVTNSSISDFNDSYDIVFRNTIFDNTPIDLAYASTFVMEDSTVRHSSATGIRVGITSNNSNTAVISHTLISGAGTGIGVQLVSGRLAVTDSTIANHQTGLKYTNTGAGLSVNGSNLIGNSLYAIENLGTPNIDATGSYFGTADTAQIAALIFDEADNPAKGLVDTSGFLTALNPNAPSATAATVLQITPTLPDFGGVLVGNSHTLSLTLTNESATPIQITNVTVNGAGFSADTSPLTVPANGTNSLALTFTPTITDLMTGMLTLTHDAAGGITAIPLRGVGLDIACTSVQGTLSSDTIWDDVSQPYCVTNDLFVSADTTLTISPSVTVLWAGPYDLLVAGTIVADGLPSDPISFNTVEGTPLAGATFLKFAGAALENSVLDHITLANAERGIHVGDETEFEQGNKNLGTLSITNLALESSEIRTGGYETAAAIDISDSTLISSTILGEYPRSEPITIRSSALSNMAIQSDSYNKGITLLDSAIFDSALTIGCCGANFQIIGSTLVDSSLTDYNDSYDVNIIDSRLINTAVDLPSSGNVMVTGSTIEHGTSAGVRGKNITVQHSLITGNGTGVGVELMNGSGTVISSTIRAHQSGIQILDSTEWDNVALHGNNLYENSGDVSVRNLSRQPINAQHNYWGTVVSAEIDTTIFDYYDDGYYGIVDYTNFLSEPTPVPAAPTTGVRPIDPAVGLTMTYTDTQGSTMTLTVPPNAVDEDTLLVYVPLSDVPDRIDSTFANRAFMLLAYRNGMPSENVVFNIPATITLDYDLTVTNARGTQAATALPHLAHWNGESWSASACGNVAHNANSNQLTVDICSTGQHALFRDAVTYQFKLFLPNLVSQ